MQAIWMICKKLPGRGTKQKTVHTAWAAKFNAWRPGPTKSHVSVFPALLQKTLSRAHIKTPAHLLHRNMTSKVATHLSTDLLSQAPLRDSLFRTIFEECRLDLHQDLPRLTPKEDDKTAVHSHPKILDSEEQATSPVLILLQISCAQPPKNSQHRGAGKGSLC
jgi:hypothetical protein